MPGPVIVVKGPGGIFAGHDYSPKWPKNIVAVDVFREDAGEEIAELHLTERDETPSWVVRKV